MGHPDGGRYIIYGAGAIGGAIGGRLFQHGYDVVLVARGAQYTALRDPGLQLISADTTSHLAVPVADSAAAAIPAVS